MQVGLHLARRLVIMCKICLVTRMMCDLKYSVATSYKKKVTVDVEQMMTLESGV